MCTSIDWAAVGSIFTGLGFVVGAGVLAWSIYSNRQQNEIARFSLGVDLLLRHDQIFNSQEFKHHRCDAARYYSGKLEGPNLSDKILDDGTNGEFEVINFFEGVGLLLRRKAIDEEVLWVYFSYWIFLYHHLALEYIQEVRKSDNTFYTDFLLLYDAMLSFQKRKNGMEISELVNLEKIKLFLQEESRNCER